MRAAKRLRIGWQLWNPEFRKRWMAENVVLVERNIAGKRQVMYVKKTDLLTTDRIIEQGSRVGDTIERIFGDVVEISEDTPVQATTKKEKDLPWAWSPKSREKKIVTIKTIFSTLGWTDEQVKGVMMEKYAKERMRDLTDEEVDRFLAYAREQGNKGGGVK